MFSFEPQNKIMDNIDSLTLRPPRVYQKAIQNYKPIKTDIQMTFRATGTRTLLCRGKTHKLNCCDSFYDQFKDCEQKVWKDYITQCRKQWNECKVAQRYDKVCTDVVFHNRTARWRQRQRQRKITEKHSHCYTIQIPARNKIGKMQVCANLYKYLYDIDKRYWSRMLDLYWKQLQNNEKLTLRKHPGYSHSKRPLGRWQQHFEKWVPHNLHCEYSHYAANDKAHPVRYRQIHISSPNSEHALNYIKLYCVWMKDYNPAIYKIYGEKWIYQHRATPTNWQGKLPRNAKGHPTKEYSPSPVYKWWKVQVQKIYNFQFKPLSIDTCNRCKVYKVKLSDAQTAHESENVKKVRILWNLHKYQARWGYQVTSQIDFQTKASWDSHPNRPVLVNQPWMHWKATGLHLVLDFDKDRNEMHGIQQLYYNSDCPQFVSMNFHQTPRDVLGDNSAYLWSKGL